MFPWQNFLMDLFVMVLFFTVYVIGTISWKPRIWLHDFPADIQAMAPPKTAEEQRLTMLLGTPFILLFFGLPIFLGWDLPAVLGDDFNFMNAWIYGYALFIGINLWDLIVIDIVGFALTDPENPPIAGTEGAAGWRDYAFHFHAFLRGCMIGLVFALVFALAVTNFA